MTEAVAIRDYRALGSAELSFRNSERLTIVEGDPGKSSGWLRARNASGEEGRVPAAAIAPLGGLDGGEGAADADEPGLVLDGIVDTGAAGVAGVGGTGRKPNPADFIARGLRGEVVVRLPGSIGGQQFVVEDCEDCVIVLCDASATVSVDECKRCRIFIGPCESSVFVRTCVDCHVVAACQQFRVRDCHNTDLLLHVLTQPIIEESGDLRVGCFAGNYDGIAQHFADSHLDVFHNQWWRIYDFNVDHRAGADTQTPNPHWSFAPLDAYTGLAALFGLEGHPGLTAIGFTLEPSLSYAPQTIGQRTTAQFYDIAGTARLEQVFVLFFAQYEGEALEFVCQCDSEPGTFLIDVKRTQIPTHAAQQLFSKVSARCSLLPEAAAAGPVVGCLIGGPEGVRGHIAQRLGAHIATVLPAGRSDVIAYASPNGAVADYEADVFFTPAADAWAGQSL